MEGELTKKAAKDPNAKRQLDEVKRQILDQQQNGDPVSIAKLKELENMRNLVANAISGDGQASKELQQRMNNLRSRAKAGDPEAMRML